MLSSVRSVRFVACNMRGSLLRWIKFTASFSHFCSDVCYFFLELVLMILFSFTCFWYFSATRMCTKPQKPLYNGRTVISAVVSLPNIVQQKVTSQLRCRFRPWLHCQWADTKCLSLIHPPEHVTSGFKTARPWVMSQHLHQSFIYIYIVYCTSVRSRCIPQILSAMIYVPLTSIHLGTLVLRRFDLMVLARTLHSMLH